MGSSKRVRNKDISVLTERSPEFLDLGRVGFDLLASFSFTFALFLNMEANVLEKNN